MEPNSEMRLISSLGHNPKSAFRMIPKSLDDDIAPVEIIDLLEWQEGEELKNVSPCRFRKETVCDRTDFWAGEKRKQCARLVYLAGH
jgi:hypothetical protein